MPPTSKEWLFSNTGVWPPLRESLSRLLVVQDAAAALVTQVLTSVAVPLQAGDLISRVAFRVGATAASVPTNAFVALYSNAATPALLAQSADTAAAAIAADTWYDQPLQSPVAITVHGVYYAALMVSASTVPSLMCSASGRWGSVGPLGALTQKALSQTSGAGLVSTAPATITDATDADVIPYAVCR